MRRRSRKFSKGRRKPASHCKLSNVSVDAEGDLRVHFVHVYPSCTMYKVDLLFFKACLHYQSFFSSLSFCPRAIAASFTFSCSLDWFFAELLVSSFARRCAVSREECLDDQIF